MRAIFGYAFVVGFSCFGAAMPALADETRLSLVGVSIDDSAQAVIDHLRSGQYKVSTENTPDPVTRLIFGENGDDLILVEVVSNRPVYIERYANFHEGSQPTVADTKARLLEKFGTPTSVGFSGDDMYWTFPDRTSPALRRAPDCGEGGNLANYFPSGHPGVVMHYWFGMTRFCNVFSVSSRTTTALRNNALVGVLDVTIRNSQPQAEHFQQQQKELAAKQKAETEAAGRVKPPL